MRAWFSLPATLFAMTAFGCLPWMVQHAEGQTVVQLPSFSQFSYSGSVWVPDRGSAYLGGVKRSASRSSGRGLTRNRAQLAGFNHGTAQVRIIDHEQIDREVRGGIPRETIGRLGQDGNPRMTPRTDSRAVDQLAEAKALVRFARRQYQSGDRQGAKYAYQMAIGKLSGRLRQLAIAEYRRLY